MLDYRLAKFINDPFRLTNVIDLYGYLNKADDFTLVNELEEFLCGNLSEMLIIELAMVLYLAKDENKTRIKLMLAKVSHPDKGIILNRLNEMPYSYYNTSEDSYRLELYKFITNRISFSKFSYTLDKYSILKSSISMLEMKDLVALLRERHKTYIGLFLVLAENNLNGFFDKELIYLFEALPIKTQINNLGALPECVIRELDLSFIIDNLNCFDAESDNLYKIIAEKLSLLDYDARLRAFLNLCNKTVRYNVRNRNGLISIYKDMPKSSILYSYITSRAHAWNARRVYSGVDFNNDLRTVLDLNSLFTYFVPSSDINFEIDDEDNDSLTIIESYTLRDLCGHALIDYSVYLDKFGNEVDTYRNNYYNIVDEAGGNNRYLRWLIAYQNTHDAEFIEKKKNISLEANKYLANKRNQALIESFNMISTEEADFLVGRLDNNNLVGFSYYFSYLNTGDANELDEDYFEYSLSLKIGSSKMYIISNISDFISNMNSNSVIKYGKDLTFRHTLENIKDIDKEAIEYIIGLDSECNRKLIILNKNSIAHLFKLLKDRDIFINDKPYRCTLREVRPGFTLDRDYILSSRLKSDIMVVGNNFYILDDINHELNIIANESRGLFKFTYLNPNASIEGVKDEFADTIYSMYSEQIDINNEIRDTIISSSMEINAYFDIDNNGHILVEAKYIRNNKEINISDLNSKVDSIKANRFEAYLKHLGFIDNRLINEDNILCFLRLDLKGLKRLCNVYLSESLSNKKLQSFQTPRIKLVYDNEIMNAFLGKSDYSDEELYDILRAIRNKRRFVLLKEDTILALDNKQSDDFYNAVTELDLDERKLSEPVERPLYQSLIALNHLDSFEIDSYIERLVSDLRGFRSRINSIPSVNAKLRHYQEEGYSWLRILSDYRLGGILADDMGLGKTLQIITLLAGDNSLKPNLIVAPKSLIFNWLSEFNKFLPDYEATIIYGSAKERANIINSIDYTKRMAYITSYDSIRQDYMLYSSEFNFLIIDEAQYIKNYLAQTSKRIKEIKAERRFALTGTPIENDIFDLWSIFDFLMPGYLPKVTKFKELGFDNDFQQRIKNMVAPFILRRTKEAVLTELPNKFERVISADMTEEQRKIYDAFCLDAQNTLNHGGQAFDVLHMLTRLRQICVDPKTFIEDYKGESGKINMLKEIIKEYISNDHRILIFSQFVKALNIVKEYLDSEEISYYMITGDTKGEDRIRYVNEFNKNDSIKVFLISLKAGGNGLNLVGADTVIHLDPWWNLASENQATDRAYRMGQTRNVEVIRLIVSDSIEQRVVELQYKKKELIDKLISNDTNAIERLTIDDMKYILR